MFKELQDQLAKALTNLRAQCNKALEKLPPLEQHAASSEIRYGMDCLNRAADYLKDYATDIESKITEMVSKAERLVNEKAAELAETKAQELLTAKVTAGEYLSKADAQAAATTAAAARETEVRATIEKANARRQELCTAKDGKPALLSREAADKLPEAVLLADDFVAQASKVKVRMDKLTTLNVKPDSALASEVASMSLDAAGDAAFNGRISMIEEVVAGSGTPTGKVKTSLAGINADTASASKAKAPLF